MEKKIYIRTLILLSIFVSGLGYLPFEVKGATGVPEIIHYQGRLLNSVGDLLGSTGTNYCFRFSIYDDAAVGAPDTKLWPAGTPSGMKLNVKNGVFNVGVGDTAAGGDTLNYNFQDNDTVYLNVEVAILQGTTCADGDVAEDWENVAPRQQITASGFAINASTLLGFTPSQYASGTQIPVLNSGNLSLGGTNPQINATGTNTLTFQGAGTGNIQFFSASNTLSSSGALTLGGSITSTGLTINSFGSGGLVFAGSGGSLAQSSTSLVWDNVNGRLGIGTNVITPSSTLHVSGTALFKPGTDSITAFQFQPSSSTTPILNIDSINARVGIGTNSPAFKLDVSGDGRFTGGLTIEGNTILGNASTSDLVTFNSRINSDFTPSVNATYDIGSPALYWDDAFLDSVTVNNISAGSSTIAGTSAANFTINTDNATVDTENMSLIFFRGTVVPNALIDWDAVLDRFDFNQPVFIQNDSNSTTIISLLVQASSGQTADIFRVSDSSGTSTLAVTSGGKVGIGTTSPSTTLHVIGTGRFSSGLTLDNGLTLTTGNFTLSGLNTNSLLYTSGSNVLTALASSTAAKVLVATSTAPYFSWETVPAITSLNGLTGGIQTFATSTETNLGIKIVSSGTTHTFTPIWIGTLGVGRGGTGTSTVPANGQLLIGNGTDYTLGTLAQGTGLSVANATGTITLTNTGVQSAVAGGGISVSSATGTVTIANTGVLSLTQSTGISLSSTTGNIGITNTGVQSLTAGEDISVSSATGTVTLNNTAVTRRALQGTGISIVTTAGSSTITNTGVQSLTGTANQITVSAATGTVTLSTPQDIAAGSSPTFTGLTLSGLTPGSVLFASTGGLVTQSSTKLYWDNVNGRLGIGANAPSTTLDVVGSGRISATSTTAFQIQSSSTGLTFDSVNNRLGIGTVSPKVNLDVGSGVDLHTGFSGLGSAFAVTNSGAASQIYLGQDTTHGLMVQWNYNATAANANVLFRTFGASNPIDFQASNVTVSTGNVGIGTTSPSTTLHVAGTERISATSTTAFQIVSSSTGLTFDSVNNRLGIGTTEPNVLLHLEKASADLTFRMKRTGAGAADWTWTIDGSGDYVLQEAGAGTAIHLKGGNDNLILLENGGNVGIGTTGPARTLDVAGVIGVTDSITLRGTILTNSATAGEEDALTIAVASDDIIFRNSLTAGTSEAMRITLAGNVGIGTATPSSTLDVRGNLTLSSGAKISPLTDAAAGLKISTATGTDYVFFDTTNARVGIGGVTPSTTLHVVGNIGVTGPTTNSLIYTNATGILTALASSTAGKVLTATGTAPYFSWETASGGITSLNGLTGATQTFAADTGISISSAGSAHTFGVATSTNFVWTGRHTFNATSTLATTTLTGSTAGSVLFIGAGNAISQSSTALVWDNVNGRLGVGTSIITPSSTLHVSGTALFKPGTDSATAFQFQNSSGNSLLTVDTTNSKVTIGPNGSAPGLLVLGTSSTSTDPTCTAGAVYYNASTTQFRGCAGSSWTSLGDNEPAARIFHNADQSTSHNTAFLVLFNSEDFDTDNMHSTSTNTSRITINTAGVYQITTNTDWATNSTGSRSVSVRKNGSNTSPIANMKQGGNLDDNFTMTTLQNLAVGDFIEVTVFQDSGGALNLLTTANHSPYFMAVKVADPPSGADLAELFPSTEELSAGDIVAIDTGNPIHIKKSEGVYSSRLLGVVSTAPGLILGERADEPTFPIALAGRVPVKVSGINGPIAVGDFITSSPVPGVGMKATKAGPVIGKALSAFDPEHDLNPLDGEGTGVVVMLVNLGYYNGQTVVPSLPGLADIISPSSTSPVDAGKQILLELLNRKDFTEETPSGATLYLSELNTDRVTAGLEVVSPRIITQNLATDTIQPATGQDLTISLNSEGKLVVKSISLTSVSSTDSTSTETIKTSETVFSIDSSGNAFFAGEVRAGAVTADKISGLEILTDKISSLSNTVQDLVTTEGNGSSTISIKGGLTVIGDASFGEVRAMNIFAESINSPSLDSLKEGIDLLASTTLRLEQESASSSQAIDVLMANLNLLSERLVPLESQQKVSLSSSSTQSGGLNIDEVSILKGGLKVNSIGALDSEITFMNDVVFFGRPYFATDTAGFAVVSQGQREVNITFEREYIEKPIVNTTISLDESVAPSISEQILGGDIRYIVTKVGVKGFTILLNKPAPTDIPFSWTALAVKGAKTFTLIPSPAPALEAPVIETQSSSSSESTAGTSSEINANSEPEPEPAPAPQPSPEATAGEAEPAPTAPAESASSTL